MSRAVFFLLEDGNREIEREADCVALQVTGRGSGGCRSMYRSLTERMRMRREKK